MPKTILTVPVYWSDPDAKIREDIFKLHKEHATAYGVLTTPVLEAMKANRQLKGESTLAGRAVHHEPKGERNATGPGTAAATIHRLHCFPAIGWRVDDSAPLEPGCIALDAECEVQVQVLPVSGKSEPPATKDAAA